MLYLRTATEVQRAAEAILDRVKRTYLRRASMACWCRA